METVLCIPNFSEGRRMEVVEAIIAAIAEDAAVTLLDWSSDSEHNRSVVTFAGGGEAVVQAALRGAAVACQLIDLTKHHGKHPRMGATDVIPLVPVEEVSVERCIQLAHTLAERLAKELSIPVFLYEDAATTLERRNLADVRRGEFEGLRESISQTQRCPDYGPPAVHPTAGAIAVGVRLPLIAFNVNLHSEDVQIARQIARAVRASSGGLIHVKAMGLALPQRRQVQVSMNLTNYLKTPIYRALELVRTEAARFGVAVAGSEIVGLAPQAALLASAAYYLQLREFSPDQILEEKLRQQKGGSA